MGDYLFNSLLLRLKQKIPSSARVVERYTHRPQKPGSQERAGSNPVPSTRFKF